MMDAHQLIELERQLVAAVDDLHRRTSATAMARQVKEFINDSRKNVLAKHMVAYLRDGESNPRAETMARASQQFLTDINQLESQYQTAEKHILEWDALHCKVDALRSALSLAKETLKL